MIKLLFVFFLVSAIAYTQTVSGRIVNSVSQGLEGKKVDIHLTKYGNYTKYTDFTDANGSFAANSTTDIKDDRLLPDDYAVSLNYPQPFNPKTIFNITLPQSSQISVDVFNILGQKVHSLDKKEYSAGLNKLVVEMNGFSNGVYIARINIDDKYFVSRKLLLIYGSQHAQDIAGSSLPDLTKPFTQIILDSITVSGDAIYTKTVHYGHSISTSLYNVGDIIVDSHYINLNLSVKKLMQWKQTNNHFANALVKVWNDSNYTDSQGMVSFTNVPAGRVPLVIEHNGIYKREAILRLQQDSTHTEYILDKINYSQTLMNFTDIILGKKKPDTEPFKTCRWTEPPIFYIVADTTQEPGRWRAIQQIAKIDTVLKPAYVSPLYPEGFLKDVQIEIGLNPPPGNTPGYYVITWGPIAPDLGLTYVKTDYDWGTGKSEGKIIYAGTTYNELTNPYEMDVITIHELSSGLSYAGRNNDIPSVWNLPVTYQKRNFLPTDLKIILYQYTRPPGNKIIDKDNDF